jgi:hypothetical protein
MSRSPQNGGFHRCTGGAFRLLRGARGGDQAVGAGVAVLSVTMMCPSFLPNDLLQFVAEE